MSDTTAKSLQDLPLEDRTSAQGLCPDMARSYNAYFRSGLYEARYPGPNRRTLRLTLDHLPQGGRFLDYGAGTGRYSLSLLSVRPDLQGVAADISPVARETLTSRASQTGLSARLAVVDGSRAAIEAAARDAGPFDLCLLAFGVLGHVAGRPARLALQDTLRRVLAPGGVMLIGLPNARRRFTAEQRRLEACGEARTDTGGEAGFGPGDVLYSRQASDEAIPLYYHLYSPAEIERDLADSGFTLSWLGAESILSESLVCRMPSLLGRLDGWACHRLPLDWAYGFLVIARPNQARV